MSNSINFLCTKIAPDLNLMYYRKSHERVKFIVFNFDTCFCRKHHATSEIGQVRKVFGDKHKQVVFIRNIINIIIPLIVSPIYCKNNDIKYYGKVTDIQKADNYGACNLACVESSLCEYATYRSNRDCILFEKINSSVFSEGDESGYQYCQNYIVAYLNKQVLFDETIPARSIPCTERDGAIYCAMAKSYDALTFDPLNHPNDDCAWQGYFFSLNLDLNPNPFELDFSTDPERCEDEDACKDWCNELEDCIIWYHDPSTFAPSCKLFKASETSYLRFEESSVTKKKIGFKHCNVHSSDYTKHIIEYQTKNPFYLGMGVECNMTIPKYCRRIPSSSMVALPTTKKGKCTDSPQSDKLNTFCESDLQDFCMYCVVGYGKRSAFGMIAMEWPSCKIQCDLNGNPKCYC